MARSKLHPDTLARSPERPKYQVIRDELMKLIHDGGLAGGERLPTERDLAGRFGVTRMTVRQAITELVRNGLVVNRRPLGNFVAEHALQAVGHRRFNLICVGNESSHAGVFIEQGVRAAKLRGLEARVLRIHPGGEHLAVDAVRGPSPTIVIGGIGNARSELHRAVLEAADRVVSIGVRLDHAGVASVVGDDPLGIRLAVAALHEAGHPRIGLVGSVIGEDHPTMELQVQLWRQAMTDLGLSRGTIDKHVLRLEPVEAGGAAMAAKRAVEAYHGRQRVRATALLCLSEASAVGVLSGLHGLGVAVPEVMSVVAYAADVRASLCVPALTSVDIDVDRHLSLAFDRVARMLEPPAGEGDPGGSLVDVVPPHLIARDSVVQRR